MILHTVNKSPFRHDALASCLRLIADGDALLFIEDGVYGILSQQPLAEAILDCRHRNIGVYALAADIRARGLQEQMPGYIAPCDDADFVDLCCMADKIQSWY